MGRKLNRETIKYFLNKVSNIFAYLRYPLPRDHSWSFGEFFKSPLIHFLWKARVLFFGFKRKGKTFARGPRVLGSRRWMWEGSEPSMGDSGQVAKILEDGVEKRDAKTSKSKSKVKSWFCLENFESPNFGVLQQYKQLVIFLISS